MASDVTGVEAAPTAPEKRPPAPARRRPYRMRFVLLYATLAGVLGAAIAGVVLLVGTGSGSTSGGPWSTWEPSGGQTSRTNQIAQHISATYRLANGHQLVDVVGKPPTVQDVPIRAVAIQGSGGSGDKVALIDDKNSLMFVLCGRGTSCAIAEGAPTIERGRLVRREGLELALYTFKYIGSVDHVVEFMPPRKGAQPTYVLYWSRTDLKNELKQPLHDTLTLKTPKAMGITPRETATIDRLTEPHMFKFTLQQAQQGDAILVLAPAL